MQTTSLGHAYGFCVIMVTFITTCLVALVALVVWRTHWAIVLALWLPFITLDGLYLSSAITKVPDGAWFTLLLAVILSCFFILWRYGKDKQWNVEGQNILRVDQLVMRGEDGTLHLPEAMGGGELTTIKGTYSSSFSLPTNPRVSVSHFP